MITIVYGHPWGKSFNAAIRDAVMDALKGREHALLDLYADGFDPAVREADLALYSAGRTNDALAQKYMEILARTREIIYIYPVWWSYSDDGSLLPKLKIEKTTIFSTSDAPGEFFAAYFNDYLPSHIFAAVGMNNVSWHNLGNIVRASASEREEFLGKIPEWI